MEVEPLGQAGRHLSSSTVGRLFAAENQVSAAELADSLCQRIGGRQRIGAAQGPVAQQVNVVGAHCQGHRQVVGKQRRPHRKDVDCSTVTIFELQRHLQRVHVRRIHFRSGVLAIQPHTLAVDPDLFWLGYYLHADHDAQFRH